MNNKVYGDVYLMLQELGDKYIKKIPSSEYNKILANKPEQVVSSQPISRRAVAYIAGLHCKYWVKDEKEKQELIKIFEENQKKHEEQYTLNSFQEENGIVAENNVDTEKALVQQEIKSLTKPEKWYQKIINLLKKIFK